MKKIHFLITVVAFSILSCTTFAQRSKTINYIGKNWNNYENYTVDIVVIDTTVERTHSILNKRVPIKNGKFYIKNTLLHTRNAYLTLYNPEGEYKYKQQFILEPGNLEFDMKGGKNKSTIKGGKYNDVIINNLTNDSEYIKRKELLNNFTKTLTQESFQVDSIRNKYSNLSSEVTKIEKQYYASIFNGQDSYAKLLVFHKMGYTQDIILHLDALEKEYGKNHPEIYLVRNTYKNIKERQQMSTAVGIGSVVKDFTAKNIEGKEFKLSNVLKDNNYVLVEFWASWCGPCRAEIPHMKKAYSKNHNKGFEIVSFTLDHKKERWEKASDDEEIPWINVSDLLAYKSPVVKLYNVQGIPANFLVDKTGTIIAKDLRQDKLDKKLHELLD